jgi:hypothetical protein
MWILLEPTVNNAFDEITTMICAWPCSPEWPFNIEAWLQKDSSCKVRSLGLFLMHQLLDDNAAALVVEGIARRDSGTNFKEDSAIGFFYQWARPRPLGTLVRRGSWEMSCLLFDLGAVR